jgi:very-short-patch-repair endonuclease
MEPDTFTPSPLAGEGWDGGMDKARVRELRKHMTEAERALWRHLRLRQLGGFKFRRQQPLGNYIVDFVCLEKRLIVEVDGGQHSEQVRYDSERDAWLESQGFSLLRFWNNQVLEEIEAVKEVIIGALAEQFSPPPSSSPARGEEIE